MHEAADLLAEQGASLYRVRAYRRAGDWLETFETDVGEILKTQGLSGLIAVPTIGRSIASAIAEMLRTGRWSMLERIRGDSNPEALVRQLPGLGPELARRIHDTLGIDTLESLEVAAWDGSLEAVRGIGPRRLAMIRSELADALARVRPVHPAPGYGKLRHPPVSTLLDVDAEYRGRAGGGELHRIAPRRFNPRGEKWLPILHTTRGPWHLTALYSNTARAHQWGRTFDWVVLYYHADDQPEQQATVVTESRGPLTGWRVVRGREKECRSFYLHNTALSA